MSASPAPSRLADEDLAMLLLIRHFEQACLELFTAGKISGTIHVCLGQEQVPVALRTLLLPGDFVFGNHRSHGHFLARGGDPAGLLAELMGREGGVCAGVGGSQHLYGDRFLSTGVQGEGIAVALGVARHLARHDPGRLACVYVGDGTWGEGIVYESLNIARLWRLPLLVVVENNGIAQSTATSAQMAGSVERRAHAFDVAYHGADTTDVNLLRAVLTPLLAEVRAGAGPLVVEAFTTRLGPHSKGDDSRSPEDRRAAAALDWLPAYADHFPDQVRRIDDAQRELVAGLVEDVAARPEATWAP
ncbi:thiamine pyrophosphate-dependent dehydrogenase E1 component subunit alpha [Nonomuraea sp. KC401]|uniref:thiamine pyrophosphate-dependent dehydrogenase E1 component subunit alpha n=1 Tax=unclassified Nonomuraea TaxID=2593643 RepID=UPI0010FD31E2|nr:MULTISPECIES: thiamine pyrophosphate-dependent dehydrogenase E1 component subunit alpha [unclassified Nonomuraea]NBE98017.1 thiamine pyrophosphate-dependent dehydrogenase E1 component subunit alpha [Nonomuraea sp. K271]TLF60031.1 thiamine pyrophosphate-dependent dehydrogenase E1 component subunit alpha [Nonomuraea sp. KC401]